MTNLYFNSKMMKNLAIMAVIFFAYANAARIGNTPIVLKKPLLSYDEKIDILVLYEKKSSSHRCNL